MSAKGMKSYYKYESMEMETAGKFSLNLSYLKKDYFLTIPLVTTRGSDKISLSAIYSSDNGSYQSYGGKYCIGGKCNLVLSPKITQIVANSKIATLSADGSINEYIYKENNVYENAVLHSKIQLVDNEYILTNNDGDKLYYSGEGQFAYKVQKEDYTVYNITVSDDNIIITNNLCSVVEVQSDGNNITDIIYTENNEVITRVSFVYKSGILIGIKYYEGYYFQYENKYDFVASSNRLLFIKDGYGNISFDLELTKANEYSLNKYNLSNNHKVGFVQVKYNSDNTVVTDVFDNTLTYYFNSDSTCKYIVDSFRNYTIYTYDDLYEVLNYGTMQYSSDNMLINGNLLVTKTDDTVDIDGFEWGGTALKIENTTLTTPFSQFGYSSVLHIETPEKTQSGDVCQFSLSQIIERNISLNDSFEFSFLVKNNTIAANPNSKVELYLVLIGDDEETNIAAKYSLDLSQNEYKSWQLTTLAIVAEQSYSKIQILVHADADVSFYIGDFRLIALKKSVDITYNGEGKVENVSTADKEKVYSYDGYKLESATDNDGNYVKNYYDDKNRLVKIVYPNGTIRTYQYNDKNNQVTCDTMTSYRYEMSTQTKFDSENNFVQTETGQNGYATLYAYNKGLVSQIKNAEGTSTNYEYYHNLDLKSLNVSSVTNGFGYENGDLNYAETNDLPRYNIQSEDGNLQKVELLRGDKTSELCSYNYLVKNGTVTSLMTRKNYPNGDMYLFEYNTRGQVQKVQYVKNYQLYNVATYTYDPNDGKLLSVKDELDDRTVSYTYDFEGRVTQIDSVSDANSQKYRYFYDAANKPLFQIKKYLSFENYTEILPLHRSTSISMEGLIHNYKTQDFYTAFFQDNFDLSNESVTKSPTRSFSADLLTHFKALPCFRNTKNFSLAYNFNVANSNSYAQTVGFWFKFINKPTTTIEMLHFGNNTQALGVYYVVASRKLQIKRGTLKIYDSDARIAPDEWNFISLTQTKQGSTYQYELCINGEIEAFSSSIATAAPTVVAIGGDTSKGTFIGYIAGIIAGNSASVASGVLTEYYRYTKDLLIEVEDGAFSSLLNYYTFLDDCTIFPLHQNLKDVEQKIGPTNTLLQKPLDFDRDYIFNYNSYAKRYMYKSNGSPLQYNLSSNETAKTVSVCFVLEDVGVQSDTKRYILELNSNGNTIGLYVNAENRLVCTIDETAVLPLLQSNKLYLISFSYHYNAEGQFEFMVFLDSEMRGYGGHRDINFNNNVSISLGCSFVNSEQTALRGSMDMFMYFGKYATADDYQRLINQSTIENVNHKYNEMGVLEEYSVSIGDKDVLKTTYTPQAVDGKLTGLIAREQNSFFDHTYEYDKIGRIVKVDEKEIYKYNEYGYLIEDNDYSYTYDSHGNILTKYVKSTKETIEYKYDDPRSADLLTSYNGVSVEYAADNPSVVSSYGNIRFSYDGRRLTRYEDGIKNIRYGYNANGLRTEKVVSATGADTVTVKYVYEGDRLLYETKNGVVTRYVYDDNGMLYGFINNSVRYYYVRDLQQRIVGIVNESGEYVAGYKYDSFGITVELLGDVEIARINSFRYKGYYYDNETGFYYCKTRYYNPYWCRWLTADDITYLDPQSISGLNLFAYCNNDPIMNLDPTGSFWFTFFTTIIGAAVGAIASVVTAVINNEEVTVKKVLSGAVSGAVSGFVLGISKGAAIATASYAAAAAESLFNEVWDYASGDKELTASNVGESVQNIVTDTVINGTINYVSNKIAADIPILKTNSGWFTPQKAASYFTKSFGQKMIGQTVAAGGIATILYSIKSSVLNVLEKINQSLEQLLPQY